MSLRPRVDEERRRPDSRKDKVIGQSQTDGRQGRVCVPGEERVPCHTRGQVSWPGIRRSRERPTHPRRPEPRDAHPLGSSLEREARVTNRTWSGNPFHLPLLLRREEKSRVIVLGGLPPLLATDMVPPKGNCLKVLFGPETSTTLLAMNEKLIFLASIPGRFLSVVPGSVYPHAYGGYP